MSCKYINPNRKSMLTGIQGHHGHLKNPPCQENSRVTLHEDLVNSWSPHLMETLMTTKGYCNSLLLHQKTNITLRGGHGYMRVIYSKGTKVTAYIDYSYI